jgi:hypothetical protein
VCAGPPRDRASGPQTRGERQPMTPEEEQEATSEALREALLNWLAARGQGPLAPEGDDETGEMLVDWIAVGQLRSFSGRDLQADRYEWASADHMGPHHVEGLLRYALHHYDDEDFDEDDD